MRTKFWMTCVGVVLLALLMATPTNAQERSSTDQLADRIAEREKQEIEIIRRYNPIIETYIQEMKPNPELGSVPMTDHYYLGVADFSKRVLDHSLLDQDKRFGKIQKSLHDFWIASFDPNGFLQMVFIDPDSLDKRLYHFEYVRREFLGEIRCIVMDITPLPGSGNGRFHGRIWVNEGDYTIVRFNGVYEPVATFSGFNLHLDSWRANLAPGLWLPTYIFSEETSFKEDFHKVLRFKSQTRLWGYDLKNDSRESEFSELRVEAPGAQDQAGASQDSSPLEAERQWQQSAENNVLDRLQRSGLLAAPGPVDKLLETVVNNLEVTNNLDIQPEVRCRVLLTSTLEAFSVGHAIVISRGLLDVLPDEASLATMLAQQLGSIVLTQPDLDKWGFNDLTNISTVEIVARLNFRESPHDLDLANQKALELLLKSPYKDKLANAGLFLRQLSAEKVVLPSLVRPNLGDRVFLADKLMATAPPLQPRDIHQTAALPLGGRIKVNPWDDEIEIAKTGAAQPLSPREKMPFEVTPFAPFLTHFKPALATAAPESEGAPDAVSEPGHSAEPLQSDSSTTASH